MQQWNYGMFSGLDAMEKVNSTWQQCSFTQLQPSSLTDQRCVNGSMHITTAQLRINTAKSSIKLVNYLITLVPFLWCMERYCRVPMDLWMVTEHNRPRCAIAVRYFTIYVATNDRHVVFPLTTVRVWPQTYVEWFRIMADSTTLTWMFNLKGGLYFSRI